MREKNKKSKFRLKRVLAILLVIMLIPIGIIGFNYFFIDKTDQTGSHTLTVNGEIELDKTYESAGLVPGDNICGPIKLKINSTAPSLLRVKINPYYKNSENSSDKIENLNIININYTENDKWLKGNDGYYYYKDAVKLDNNGSKTIDFIDFIKFELSSDEDANDFQNKYIGVDVSMQMVQAKYDAYKTKWNINTSGEVYNLLNGLSTSVESE